VLEPHELEQEIVPENLPPQQPQQETEDETNVRRSQRVRRSAIPDFYETYICADMNSEGDPTTFEEAMSSPVSSKWFCCHGR